MLHVINIKWHQQLGWYFLYFFLQLLIYNKCKILCILKKETWHHYGDLIQNKSMANSKHFLLLQKPGVVMGLQATCGSLNSWARHNTFGEHWLHVKTSTSSTRIKTQTWTADHSDSQHPAVHIMDVTHIRCDRRGGWVWMRVFSLWGP